MQSQRQENRGRHKLKISKEKIARIAKLYLSGYKLDYIAERLGMNRTYIRTILQRHCGREIVSKEPKGYVPPVRLSEQYLTEARERIKIMGASFPMPEMSVVIDELLALRKCHEKEQ